MAATTEEVHEMITTTSDTHSPSPATASDTRRVVTLVLLGIQSSLFVLGGLLLWTWDSDGRRRFIRRFLHDQLTVHPLRWGLALIVVGAVLAVIAVGLARTRVWARIAVYIVEPIVAIGSILRAHPVRSMLGAGLAVAIVILVAITTPLTEPSDLQPGKELR
jgi:hypothetical protein